MSLSKQLVHKNRRVDQVGSDVGAQGEDTSIGVAEVSGDLRGGVATFGHEARHAVTKAVRGR